MADAGEPPAERPGTAAAEPSLRHRALRGSRYLVVREAAGAVLRSLGLLLLTGLIGPYDFGLFAGPLFIVTFLTILATTGTDVVLIRRPGRGDTDWLHQGFSYLLVTGVAFAVLGVLAAPLLAGVLSDGRAVAPFQVLVATIPINILWVPARAKLERAMRFKPLAWTELAADAAQYATAIPLAFAGAGVWAAVFGFVARQVTMLVVVHAASGYRPRWRWRFAMVREIVGVGSGFSGQALAIAASDMVVPLVVGAFLGPAGVGVAALTLRLAQTLSFVSRVTYRVSVVTLSKLQHDLPRVRKAASEMMQLQILGVAPLLVSFSVVGAVCVPLFLGEEWRGVIALFPFVALSFLLSAAIQQQAAALSALGRSGSLMATAWTVTVLVFGGTALLVPLVGVKGYGIARTLGLLAQLINYWTLRGVLDAPLDYRRSLLWTAVFAPLLFVPAVPAPWVVLCLGPPVAILVRPGVRRRLFRDLRRILDALLGRGMETASS